MLVFCLFISNKKVCCIIVVCFVDVRDLQQFGEAMAMLEADVRGDAEAIMQILSRRHRIITDDESNAPDVPDTPPIAPPSAAGSQSQEPQGQSSSQGQSTEQGEGQSQGQEESPMETDKPGKDQEPSTCLN